MWQYQNTDELYHANMYKNMNKKSNHKLYHSDVYLGKDFSDGIKHWKYIKREKVNGKWRYYYKNDKLDSLKSRRDIAIKEYNDMATAYDNSIKNNKNGAQNIDVVLRNYKYLEKLDKESFEKSMAYASEEYKDRKRRERYEKYLISPMNKVSDAVYKGKQKINSILDNLNGKKKKDYKRKAKYKGNKKVKF